MLINILIVALIVGYGAFVIYRMHKKKKEGGSCCSCGCGGGCPGCSSASKEEENK